MSKQTSQQPLPTSFALLQDDDYAATIERLRGLCDDRRVIKNDISYAQNEHEKLQHVRAKQMADYEREHGNTGNFKGMIQRAEDAHRAIEQKFASKLANCMDDIDMELDFLNLVFSRHSIES